MKFELKCKEMHLKMSPAKCQPFCPRVIGIISSPCLWTNFTNWSISPSGSRSKGIQNSHDPWSLIMSTWYFLIQVDVLLSLEYRLLTCLKYSTFLGWFPQFTWVTEFDKHHASPKIIYYRKYKMFHSETLINYIKYITYSVSDAFDEVLINYIYKIHHGISINYTIFWHNWKNSTYKEKNVTKTSLRRINCPLRRAISKKDIFHNAYKNGKVNWDTTR